MKGLWSLVGICLGLFPQVLYRFAYFIGQSVVTNKHIYFRYGFVHVLWSTCMLTLLLVYTDCCTDQRLCRCSVVQGTLYADCSHLGLRSSPLFWSNLTRIRLSLKILTQISPPQSPPSNLTYMYLDLSYNTIKSIENNTFKGIWKLSDLRLNGNKLVVPVNLDRNVLQTLKI